MLNIIGVRKLPLLVGDAPRAPWKNNGMNTKLPNIPKPVQKTTTIDRLTIRLLYMWRGIIGLDERSSTMKNRGMAIDETTRGTII